MANDYICRWDILKNIIFLPHRRIIFFRVHQRQKKKKKERKGEHCVCLCSSVNHH